MKEPEIQVEQLRCRLSEAEKALHADAMAKVSANLDALERERDEASKGFKSREKTLQGEMATLSREIREGQIRDVEVRMFYDFEKSTATKVRLDTGEVIGSRSMTAAERQEQFNFGAEPPVTTQ